MGAYASEPLTFFYTSPHVECVCEGWCGCVCVPYLGECVYESMLSLMRPHMRDSWVRIHLTCGCVYIWLVGAYATLVGAYTGVRMQWSRIQGCVYRSAYTYGLVRMRSLLVRMQDLWVRIHMTCGCVYIWLVGAYTYDLWVRIQWGAYTVGCVYRGAYAGVCMQG